MRKILTPDDSPPYKKPVVWVVLPVTSWPPFDAADNTVGLGVPDNSITVNGLISNKYNLYTASAVPITPETCWYVLALQIPILVPEAVPGVWISLSKKPISLNALDSPLINDTSGVPYKFLILVKLPTSKEETLAFTVSKSLDLGISI